MHLKNAAAGATIETIADGKQSAPLMEIPAHKWMVELRRK